MDHNANTPPSVKDLRIFGLIFGALLAGVFGFAIPYIWNAASFPWVYPIIAGVIVAFWALLHAPSLILIYRPWMKLAAVLGWINTHLIMLIMFYLMFVPIGLLMRLLGKDPMQRKLSKEASSYRVNSQTHPKEHMEKPY